MIPDLTQNYSLVDGLLSKINFIIEFLSWKSMCQQADIFLGHFLQEKINQCHQMGNAWIFPLISHSTGTSNKSHGMGKVWEINTHIFPIVWVLFSPLHFHPIAYFII